MIKTVSFAPPRSARAAAKAAGKSASKPAKVQPARATVASASGAAVAARPAKTQSARATSGSSVTPRPEETGASPRRRAAQNSGKTPEVAVVEAEPKVIAAKKTRAAKVVPATAATSPVGAEPAAQTPAQRGVAKTAKAAEKIEVAPQPTPTEPKTETKVAPKVRRSRAPKDLALQYGAAPATEDVARNVVEKPAPRKRLTREAKAARSQMLRPDDDVLQRLQQANAVEAKKPASRGRGWEFECGRCGRITRFQTPGAICACGAIAVRE